MTRTFVPLTAAEFARQIGAPYCTVAKAVQRIRRDGRVCRLEAGSCVACGGPLLTGSMRGRLVHPARTAARNAALQRQYQREGGAQKSTPYVRQWRAEHPEELAAEREREKLKAREKWPERPEEWRVAMLDKLHAADRRDSVLTCEEAQHSGEPWDADEDQYVLDHMGEPAREVALYLGRTLWAVRGRRVLLRRMATSSG